MLARSVLDLLRICRLKYPDKTAIKCGEAQLTYSQFSESVERLAAGLARHGLRSGDRVAIMMPNLPEFPIAYYALLRLGIAVVPVNLMFQESQLQYLLRDAQVKGVIAWEGFAPQLLAATKELSDCRFFALLGLPSLDPQAASLKTIVELTQLIAESQPHLQARQCDGNEIALILYTSGTTREARGAMITHASLAASAISCWQAFVVDSDHRFAAALPLFHGLGQMLTMCMPLSAGATTVLISRFDPVEVLSTIASEAITHLVVVPQMLQLILDGLLTSENGSEESSAAQLPLRLETLRTIIVGGGFVTDQLRAAIAGHLGKEIYGGYSLAECISLAACNRPGIANKPGAVGRQLPGMEITIFDDQGLELPPGEIGEVVIRGAGLLKEYFNRPEESRKALQDGWFHTGDYGKVDESGHLYLKGRRDDVFIKGGFEIYAHEIEMCLRTHPLVKECAVIGAKDRIYGQEVKALVILKEASTITKQELLEHCGAHLKAYLRPRHIEFCSELPYGPTGKVLKKVLREQEFERTRQPEEKP